MFTQNHQEIQEIQKQLISLKRESKKICESAYIFQNTPVLHYSTKKYRKRITTAL